MEIGLKSNDYSVHSLRRGVPPYSRGLALEMIQSMGDWASLAVLGYLLRPFDQGLQVAQMLSQGLNEVG